jgi:hypothetical protein
VGASWECGEGNFGGARGARDGDAVVEVGVVFNEVFPDFFEDVELRGRRHGAEVVMREKKERES